MLWTLDTLAYYLKGCRQFTLWTDHNPLTQAMRNHSRELSERMQKFCEAIQAYNDKITHVRGVHNQICNALSRAPVGGHKGIERLLYNLRGHALYSYNDIISSVQGDITPEVLEDSALDKLWESAEKDEDYQKAAKVVANKVLTRIMKTMKDHPIRVQGTRGKNK